MRRTRSRTRALWWTAGILALTIGVCRSGDSDKQQHLCHQTYALCTSAPCWELADGATAKCSCDVIDGGKSMAGTPCENVLQQGNTVYSLFSLEQFTTGKQVMTCPKTREWTWCLDKPCTLVRGDPTKAWCTCDVIKTSTVDWITLGGNCITDDCESYLWSGAQLEDFESGVRFLRDHGDRTPVEFCPAVEANPEDLQSLRSVR
jgi:hypothetical protein